MRSKLFIWIISSLFLFFFLFNPVFADQIIDNDSPNFFVNGDWYFSNLIPGYYGSYYMWAWGGYGEASAEWVFQVPSAGTYQVFAWWSTPYYTRSPNAPFTVYHANGSTTVRMDQRINGSQWNDLGTYNFTAGDALVVLTNDAQGNPIADAVMFVEVTSLAVDFAATPLSGPDPLQVEFTNQTADPGDSFFWDFGDGETSTEENPIHVYQIPGTYTVSLTVTSGGKQGTETKDDLIYVMSSDFLAQEFIWPVAEEDFFIFQSFGNLRMEMNGYHAGTDFAVTKLDAEIRCIANGWVEDIDNGFGNSIMIRHLLPDGETVYSWYNHMAYSVAGQFTYGQFVPMGTVIGTVGETGWAPSGVHLHLEIKKYGDTYGGYIYDLSGHYNAYEFIYSRLVYNPDPPATCGDGTAVGDCAPAKPFHCIEGGFLVENSLVCGCDTGVPQTDGTCSKTESGIIIDNDDPEFFCSGYWEETTLRMGFYGADYLNAYPGDGDAVAVWTPNIEQAGYYKIYGWWRDRFSAYPTDRATNAFFTINHALGQDSVPADFSDYHKEWKYLGTFLFNEGIDNSVVLASVEEGIVQADAIRFVYDSPPDVNADFTADPVEGTVPLTVQFTDASTGNIDTWAWDFGDTGTSTLQNPSYEYTAEGTYTVSLTVTGPGGTETETKTEFIHVTPVAEEPVADFTADPVEGTVPLAVQFTDASTGNIDTWAWDFGDTGTSTLQNPSHEYTVEGTYTVSLTVTGPGGTETETKTEFIHVTPVVETPEADFTADPVEGIVPLTVQFTDASTGNIDTWTWDFGDGATSNEQHPVHEYTTEGIYTVSLTVTGPGGADSESKPDYIRVAAVVIAPVAGFTTSPTSGTAPLTVQFTDTSTGEIDTWAWDFGDDTTSNEQNPTHEYANEGIYTVVLTVTGPGGTDSLMRENHIAVTAVQAYDVIIDNEDADCHFSGTWYNSTLVPGYYGNNYRWSYGGSAAATAEWVFALDSGGLYQALAWWSAPYYTRSPDAPFTVHHEGGSTTLRMDQRTNGSQWNDLGTYTFAAGNARVTLSNDAQGNPVADAVRLIRITSPDTMIVSGPSGTINTDDFEFAFTGVDDSTPTANLVYSSMLEGYDSGWSNYTASTTRAYFDVPDGTYTFFVRARDGQGNVDPSPASQSIRVRVNAQDPVPAIRANGSSDPITIHRSDLLSVSISLDAGSATEDADWWICADTPFGWYSYNMSTGSWSPGEFLSYRGPLSDLDSTEVLRMLNLSAGTYVFYFGVDTTLSGVLNWTTLVYDSIEVNIR